MVQKEYECPTALQLRSCPQAALMFALLWAFAFPLLLFDELNYFR